MPFGPASALRQGYIARLCAPCRALNQAPNSAQSWGSLSISATLRRFLSTKLPACLSFHPSSALQRESHSPAMLLLSRLEDERSRRSAVPAMLGLRSWASLPSRSLLIAVHPKAISGNSHTSLLVYSPVFCVAPSGYIARLCACWRALKTNDNPTHSGI